MTTLREAAEVALEFLEALGENHWLDRKGTIIALREALAETVINHSERDLDMVAAPSKRKPLTDSEINALVIEWWCPTTVTAKDRKFVRAIERAHGIQTGE